MRDLLTKKLSNYAPRQLALDYPEAGILVPVTDDENNPEMIFTLRSANLKTHRGQVTGVVVGIVGLLMIGIPTASVGDTSAAGVLLVILAVACYGVAANIAGPLQRRYGSPAVLLRVLVVATVATTPWGLVGLADSDFAWSAAASNVAVGVGGTGIAYVAAASLIGRVGPVRMSAVTYVVPVVAAVLGIAILGETLGVVQVSGALVLVGGAWLTTRSGS